MKDEADGGALPAGPDGPRPVGRAGPSDAEHRAEDGALGGAGDGAFPVQFGAIADAEEDSELSAALEDDPNRRKSVQSRTSVEGWVEVKCESQRSG